MENEDNSRTSYKVSKRGNRYFKANINWKSYPENIILACRGTKKNPDHYSKLNCGTVKGFFVAEDKSDTPTPIIKRCKHLCCKADGRYISSKRARDSALRIVASALTTNWYQLKFISFNIKQSNDIYRFPHETQFEFLERKKKCKKFDFLPGEDFYTWLKRVKKIVVKDALKMGIKGLAIIFHPDRLKKKGFKKETRCWDPHFHTICFGKIENSTIFFKKMGYNYSQQQAINIPDAIKNKKLGEIAGRIAYRLNHSAYSLTPKENATHSISYAGDMGYRSLKIIDKKKIIKEVLSDSESKRLLVDIKATSEKPKYIRKKESKLIDKANYILDNKIHDYLPLKLERNINQLEKQIYDKNLILEENWKEKDLTPILNHKNEKIYQVEVEIIKTFKSLKTNKISKLSTNDFKSTKNNYQDKDNILLSGISSYEKNFLEKNL